MQIHKNHKALYLGIGLGALALISTPILVTQLTKVSTNTVYIYEPLLKNKEKIVNNLKKFDTNFKNENTKMEEKLKEWKESNKNQNELLIKINTEIDNLGNNRIELEKIINLFTPLKLNFSNLYSSLNDQYKNSLKLFNQYKENNVSLNSNDISDFLNKFQDYKTQLITFSNTINKSIENIEINLNSDFINQSSNSTVAENLINELSNFKNYNVEFNSNLDKLNIEHMQDISSLINLANDFFNKNTIGSKKLNSSLDLYLESVKTKANLINTKIDFYKYAKEMLINSLQLLSSYQNQNKNLYELIKNDSIYLNSIINDGNINLQIKQMIYKTYMYAYANKLELLAKNLLQYLTHLSETDLFNDKQLSEISKIQNDILNIQKENQKNWETNKQINELDISKVFDSIYTISFIKIGEIINIADQSISAYQTDQKSFEKQFDELQKTENFILEKNITINNIEIKAENIDNQLTFINDILKNNTVISNENKNNLLNKKVYLNDELTKIKRQLKDEKTQNNILINKYNDIAKKLAETNSELLKKLLLIKHMNYSMKVILNESFNQNLLIKDLKNKISDLVNDKNLSINTKRKEIDENIVKIQKIQGLLEKNNIENKALNEKIDLYQNKINDLNKKIANINLANRNLKANKEILETQINSINKNLNDKTENIKLLKNEISTLKSKIEQKKKELEKSELNNELKADEIEKWKSNIQENIKELKSKEEKINSLNSNIQNLKLEKEKITNILNSEKEDKIKIQKQFTLISKEKDELIEKLTKANNELILLQTNHNTVLKEKEDIERKYKIALANNASTENKLSIVIEKLKEDKNKLNETILNLKNDKENLNTEINKLNNELTKEKENKNTQNDKLALTNAKYDELKLKFNKLQNNYNTQITSLSAENEKLRNKVSELNSSFLQAYNEKQKILSEMTLEKNKLLADIEALKIKELAYVKLIIKANDIILRAIAILKTFKENDYVIHHDYSNPPKLKYVVVHDPNGYTRHEEPDYATYSKELEEYNKTAHIVEHGIRNNGKEVVENVLKVLNEWSLSDTLKNDIEKLIETSK
ncbi:hypothetical protein [Mycoplasma buteonis]|uniref:hypothetical protein n=1 Tax=Mycoplasma buteonis TaxID=171280 RepID=UPI00056B1166|nr:hypothetical protein [Mycoplasma buteonis]